MNINMNNMNINNMGMNNNQLFQNNLNYMNQMKRMNNNANLMNMQMMNMMNMNMMNMMNMNETEDVTNIQQANKVIKELKKENSLLKDKLNRIEEKLKYLEKYKIQMDLNCYYNQFDIKAYKLDNIFNLLDSDIIKEKEEFGLINKGIRNLFNKNIKNFDLIFKKIDKEFDPSTFKDIFNNLTYSVLIVSTRVKNNNRKFGVFINQNLDNNNQMINQNNQINNQPFNNPQNNQINNSYYDNYQDDMNNQDMFQSTSMFNENLNLNQDEMNSNISSTFNTNNDLNEENIFDPNYSSSNEFFVFSFNRSDIYFKKDTNILIPSFSIIYNKKYNRFLGKENPINNSPYINNIYKYKLSGENEFIIDCIEIYEIKI